MGYWSELCQTQMAQARDWLNETTAAATHAASASVRQVSRQERKSA
jgi:hypothetical protein